MPPYKRTASSSMSASNTHRKPSRSGKQSKSTPKSGLFAGNAASKRKASASVDEARKKVKATTKVRKEPTPSTNTRNEPAEEDSDKDFEIECPAKPQKKYSAAEDVYRGTDGAQFGLGVEYTVKPGRWADMKAYSNIKYAGLEFRSGEFAYFAVTLEEPKAIPEEDILASNDPLKDERDNNYIAMITEARADDTKKVYVRVMYAYWPEELPQGRQPYHGMKEVIMSNCIDILEAHSINGKVKVERIDEAVESVDGIYWRQTLDIGKRPPGKGTEPGVLSKLKGHCRCRQPMNPDQTMYICRYCTLWNHDHCLIEDVLEKAWEKHLAGTFGQGDDDDTLEVEEDDSIEVVPEAKRKSAIISSLKSMASNVTSRITGGAREMTVANNDVEGAQLDGPADITVREMSKATPKGRNKVRKAGESAPWDGKLSAIIENSGKFDKAGLVVAQIVDEEIGEVIWTSALSCLVCERRFD